MKNKYSWIREIFSEKGVMSSKRVVGFIGFISAIIFIGYITFQCGNNLIAKDLIETVLYVSTLLLGVSTIANIWNTKK